MDIVALHCAEPQGDHLAALGIVADPLRAGHANELGHFDHVEASP